MSGLKSLFPRIPWHTSEGDRGGGLGSGPPQGLSGPVWSVHARQRARVGGWGARARVSLMRSGH